MYDGEDGGEETYLGRRQAVEEGQGEPVSIYTKEKEEDEKEINDEYSHLLTCYIYAHT